MKIADNEEGHGAGRITSCTSCGAGLDANQRYCLECGGRCAPLPALIADRIAAFQERGQREAGSAGAAAAAVAAAAKEGELTDQPTLEDRFMPSPRVAAVAVMGLLTFGVLLGSVTNPVAEGAAIAPILLDMGRSAAPSAAPEAAAPATAPAATASPSRPSAPASTAISSSPEAVSAIGEEGEDAVSTTPAKKPSVPVEIPTEPSLPPVTHVFLIVLANQGYAETFGPASPVPYLANTLRAQGELLSNYYAVAGGELANEVALISGQGPTPQTAADCPVYSEIAPGIGEQRIPGHRRRLRLSSNDDDPSRPARHRGQELEGLHRGDR